MMMVGIDDDKENTIVTVTMVVKMSILVEGMSTIVLRASLIAKIISDKMSIHVELRNLRDEVRGIGMVVTPPMHVTQENCNTWGPTKIVFVVFA
jgi:hypothetical protein